MMNAVNEAKWDELFNELVPASGKCECVAGELIRAASKVYYRYYNDGDCVGRGYGKETCNPSARYIVKHGDPVVSSLANGLWNAWSSDAYEELLDKICESILEQIDKHPELREEPTEDMFDCAAEDDCDDECWEDDWNDEDEWEDEDDEV